MKYLYVAALAMILAGCATAGKSSTPALSTIAVWNETGLAVHAYFEGRKIGTVIGTRGCIKVKNVRATPVGPLTFTVTSERSFSTPVVDLRDSWSIRIGPWPVTRRFDALTLRKEEERCD